MAGVPCFFFVDDHTGLPLLRTQLNETLENKIEVLQLLRRPSRPPTGRPGEVLRARQFLDAFRLIQDQLLAAGALRLGPNLTTYEGLIDCGLVRPVQNGAAWTQLKQNIARLLRDDAEVHVEHGRVMWFCALLLSTAQSIGSTIGLAVLWSRFTPPLPPPSCAASAPSSTPTFCLIAVATTVVQSVLIGLALWRLKRKVENEVVDMKEDVPLNPTALATELHTNAIWYAQASSNLFMGWLIPSVLSGATSLCGAVLLGIAWWGEAKVGRHTSPPPSPPLAPGPPAEPCPDADASTIPFWTLAAAVCTALLLAVTWGQLCFKRRQAMNLLRLRKELLRQELQELTELVPAIDVDMCMQQYVDAAPVLAPHDPAAAATGSTSAGGSTSAAAVSTSAATGSTSAAAVSTSAAAGSTSAAAVSTQQLQLSQSDRG